MNDLSSSSAAPSSITGDDGAVYVLSPLTIGDFAEFAQWAEDQAVAKVRSRIKILETENAVTAEQKKEMLDGVFEDSDSGVLEARMMGRLPGTRQLIYLSVRRKNPAIELTAIGEIVTMQCLQEFRQQIDRLSGLEPDPNAVGQVANLLPGDQSSAD